MQFIKSLIFNIFLYFGLIFIFILAIPTLILPNKVTIFFGRLSAKYIILILKLVMNTQMKLKLLIKQHYFLKKNLTLMVCISLQNL